MKGREKRQAKIRLGERDRRIRALPQRGLIHHSSDIPADAYPIDPASSTKAGTWSPQLYYRNIHFVCCDCDKPGTWTIDSQISYFEVIKAVPYKIPKRCYDCRQKELARKTQARIDAGHDPGPPPESS